MEFFKLVLSDSEMRSRLGMSRTSGANTFEIGAKAKVIAEERKALVVRRRTVATGGDTGQDGNTFTKLAIAGNSTQQSSATAMSDENDDDAMLSTITEMSNLLTDVFHEGCRHRGDRGRE